MTTVLRRVGASVGLAVLAGAAAVTVALASLGAPGPAIAALATIVLVAVAWWSWSRPGPFLAPVAATVVVGVLVALVSSGAPPVGAVAVTVLAVTAALLDAPLAERLVAQVRTRQLPGVADRRCDPRPYLAAVIGSGLVLVAVLVVVATAAVVSPAPDPVPGQVAGLVGLLLSLALLTWATLRLRSAVRRRRAGIADREVSAALGEYAPEFLIYYSGSADGVYQVRMWLPHLARLGRRHALLVRDHELLEPFARITDLPVVSSPRLSGLDACVVPSVRTLFYVNTDSAAVDGVRYLDRTHVQLNHGDSEKPSSYHPMISMFDQVFVAGQAAIDRFAAHEVVVPPEKFVIVGRPQMARVSPHNVAPLADRPSVLYAPTWRGGLADMSFSSLAHGHAVVQELVNRGARVIFRPHPYSLRDAASAAQVARIDEVLASRRSPDTPHLGSAETTRWDILECFDRSDALVTDVSSLASDYLATGRPLAVVDIASDGSGPSLPVLAAAYRVDPAEPGPAIELLLGPDPLADTRAELRSYYLGEPLLGPDGEDLRFVRAALRALDRP